MPMAPWLVLLVPPLSSGSGSLHWLRTRLQELLLHVHLGHPGSPPFSVRVGGTDHGVRATLGKHREEIKARRAGVTLLHLSATSETPNTSAGATSAGATSGINSARLHHQQHPQPGLAPSASRRPGRSQHLTPGPNTPTPAPASSQPPAAPRNPSRPLASPRARTHAFPTWMRGTTSLLCALGRL